MCVYDCDCVAVVSVIINFFVQSLVSCDFHSVPFVRFLNSVSFAVCRRFLSALDGADVVGLLGGKWPYCVHVNRTKTT